MNQKLAHLLLAAIAFTCTAKPAISQTVGSPSARVTLTHDTAYLINVPVTAVPTDDVIKRLDELGISYLTEEKRLYGRLPLNKRTELTSLTAGLLTQNPFLITLPPYSHDPALGVSDDVDLAVSMRLRFHPNDETMDEFRVPFAELGATLDPVANRLYGRIPRGQADAFQALVAKLSESLRRTRIEINQLVKFEMVLREQLTADKLNRDTLAQVLGDDHPRVLAIDKSIGDAMRRRRRLVTMEVVAGGPIPSQQTARNPPLDWVVTAPSSLESPQTLQSQYEQAEANAANFAQVLREAKTAPLQSTDRVGELTSQLLDAVTDAFNLRTQLQEAQLDQAQADLDEARRRISQRRNLAAGIIEKRAESLERSNE